MFASPVDPLPRSDCFALRILLFCTRQIFFHPRREPVPTGFTCCVTNTISPLPGEGGGTGVLPEKWGIYDKICDFPYPIYDLAGTGWFQKISIPYNGWHEHFDPPCLRKFQNALPSHALWIPKSPPPLSNFQFFFHTLWNSCLTA